MSSSSLDDPARVVFRDPPPRGDDGGVGDGDRLFIINAARGTPMSYRDANGVRREHVVSELNALFAFPALRNLCDIISDTHRAALACRRLRSKTVNDR